MKLINDDCYKAIKEIADNSVDLIIIDPPYEFSGSGFLCGGGAFGTNERTYHNEYVDICQSSTLAERKQKQGGAVKNIAHGFNLSLFDEFKRIQPKINMYVWCSKAQVRDILNWADRGGTSPTYWLGTKLTLYQLATELISMTPSIAYS